jgi:hypothetical protein
MSVPSSRPSVLWHATWHTIKHAEVAGLFEAKQSRRLSPSADTNTVDIPLQGSSTDACMVDVGTKETSGAYVPVRAQDGSLQKLNGNTDQKATYGHLDASFTKWPYGTCLYKALENLK